MKAQEVLEIAKNDGRAILTEYESKEILRAYSIPTTMDRLATSAENAATIASKIGFPVVLKIHSHDITHKTEVRGVKLDLKDEEEVKKAFNEVINKVKQNKPEAKIKGLLVQNLAPPGREVIIGVNRDPQFGPIIVFGLGGIFVEVLKDVSFRLPPISKKEAISMMKEIKGYPILEGIRGAPSVDIISVADVMEKTSKMVMDLPEIMELDMNPIILYEKGLTVVDARVIINYNRS